MADAVESAPAASTVTYWIEQIEGAQKWSDDWYNRGKAVIERYLDKADAKGTYANKVNTLWANIQTIMPALYAKTPTPKVSRRYRDKDPVGRWGAIVLERALDYQLDAYDVDYNIRNAVLDFLLPGRGQIWVHYEPTIANDGKPNQSISWERCYNEHLHWKDFLTNPARTWEEVWWVAKRAWLSKDEALKHEEAGRFTKGVSEKLTFSDQKEDGTQHDNEKGNKVKKAPVWEIWSKTNRLVYYVSRNCPTLLGPERPPPLNFEGFFPCPRPIVATVTTDSILPTPDFCQYQNQADEIDLLTARINALVKALKVVGIYDATSEALGKLLDSADNTMVPCENFAVLATSGGIEKAIGWFPLDMIIKALEQCYISRDQATQKMYEVTGISDIVRGASDASETATAQQIKSQWGGLRIRDRQAEVQRFVRDVMRLNSEIIAERFQDDTLKTMSNAPILTQKEKEQLQQRKQIAAQLQQAAQADPQGAQQAVQANPQLMQMAQPLSMDDEQKLREPAWEEILGLLRDEKLRCYRIDIETDSTIQADEQQEKADRTEFLTAVTGAVTAWGPILMQAPQFGRFFGELLTWGARAFKTADTLESAIEEAVDSINQQAMAGPQQQPAPPPDPKLEVDKAQIGLDRERMTHEAAQTDKEQTLRREEMAHEKAVGQQTIEGEVQKARATQPQPQDVTAALAPLMEIVQAQMQALAQSNEMGRQQLAQQQADGQAALQQAIAMLVQIASAPKEVKFHRGANNLIEGGTARPVIN